MAPRGSSDLIVSIGLIGTSLPPPRWSRDPMPAARDDRSGPTIGLRKVSFSKSDLAAIWQNTLSRRYRRLLAAAHRGSIKNFRCRTANGSRGVPRNALLVAVTACRSSQSCRLGRLRPEPGRFHADRRAHLPHREPARFPAARPAPTSGSPISSAPAATGCPRLSNPTKGRHRSRRSSYEQNTTTVWVVKCSLATGIQPRAYPPLRSVGA